MSRLKARIERLEAAEPSTFKGWHVAVQKAGQTEEEAWAAYQAEHGPVDIENEGVLWVMVRHP